MSKQGANFFKEEKLRAKLLLGLIDERAFELKLAKLSKKQKNKNKPPKNRSFYCKDSFEDRGGVTKQGKTKYLRK